MSRILDNPTFDFKLLEKSLRKAKGDSQLFQSIVDSPFDQRVEAAMMFLGIMVLLLVDHKALNINRVALSKTELAKRTTDVSVIPFEEIKIPLNTRGNIIAEAIESGTPQDTTDWRFLFHPSLTPEESRINQASAGISYSAVYPLKARQGGALIFSYFQYEEGIDSNHRDFMSRYAELVSDVL